MTTESGTNNGHVAFSNDVAGDVEEATPVAKGPSRQSLSQSEKAWDIDGDGTLDPTELALKDIDKTGKGTLSKDQMYHLMNQNLAVQKDLKKVKKFVIGLVVLTALLALANVGVSFAAAYLAKDTKTVEGKLVVSSSGETVKTDSTTTVFVVDTDLQERVRRERRLACTTENAGQGKTDAGCNFGTVERAWGLVDKEHGEAIVDSCRSGGTVAIERSLEKTVNGITTTHAAVHTICPPAEVTYDKEGNSPWSMYIHRNGVTNAITVTYKVTDGGSEMFTINGLSGDEGDTCTNDNDCGDALVCSDENFCKRPLGSECDLLDACSSNLKCEGTPSACVRSEGHVCDDANSETCGSKLACESNTSGPNTCKGLYLHTCEVTGQCSSQQDVTLTCDADTCVGTAALNQGCDVSNPCGTDLKCDVGICKGDAGYRGCANDVNQCGTNLACEANTCVGLQGVSCDTDADCSSAHTCATFFSQFGEYKVCACTFDGNACGTDEVCSTTYECGQSIPDVVPSCQQKSVMDQSCGDGSTCQVGGLALDDHTCEGTVVKEGGSGEDGGGVLCPTVVKYCGTSEASMDPDTCEFSCPDGSTPTDSETTGA